MIPTNRKLALSKQAESIAKEFTKNNVTLLIDIADYEDLFVYFDDYENAFEGMLLYDNKNFHIHINTKNENTENLKRNRFTFAHELGHYFIDEHRLGLKYNILEPHSSFHNLGRKDRIELEADYFASCLLMPKEKFRIAPVQKKFSFSKILEFSELFQTSVLATLIRFAEVGTHEIFAVFVKDNIVKWYVKSDEFPNWKMNFEVHKQPPKNTVVADFFSKKVKCTEVEEMSADYWFKPPESDYRADKTMKEQCYYSDAYGYVISLIWFD